MAENNRIRWIDIARGIGIFLVTLIHASTSAIRDNNAGVNILYLFTVSSAVQLIMFLSGYTFGLNRLRYSKMGFKGFAKKKAMSLMLPYLVYAVLIYLIFEIMSFAPGISGIMNKAGYGRMGLANFIIGLIIGNNSFSVHLWFLYVLFIYEIITFLLYEYNIDRLLLLIAVITGICGFFFYLGFVNISLSLANGIAYFVYYVFGIIASGKNFNRIVGTAAMIIWPAIFFVFLCFARHGQILYNALTIIIPFMPCIAVQFLSRNIGSGISDFLERLGVQSMVIYLFQQPFFGSALGTILYKTFHIPAWPSVFACIICSIGFPLIIRYVFVRFKWFRVLFAVR